MTQAKSQRPGMIDYASTAAKKASAIVFGLISAMLLARYLGPEDRGNYAIIVSFSAILFSILNFGVSNYYAHERRQKGHSLASSYVRYFFALFAVVLSAGFVWMASSEGPNLYAIGTLLAAFSLLRMQTQSVLLVEDIRGATRAAIMGSASEAFILLLCYLLFDRYVVLAVSALVAKELVILSASTVRLRRFAGEQGSIWPIGAKLLTDGKLTSVLMAFTLTALITINYKADTLVMAFLGLPAAQIGIYALGVTIAEYLWIVSDIFKDVQISRTARGGTADGVAWAIRMAVALTLVAYASFLIVGWFLISLVFGDAFSQSYFITLAMLMATIFMVPCKIIGIYYISLGRFSVYLKIMAVAVAVNLGLNLALIPAFGIFGAVVASIASYGVAGAWMLMDFAAVTSVPVRQVLLIRPADINQVISIIGRHLPMLRNKTP